MFQVIYQVRSCTEDHGIHRFTISPISILSTVCTFVSHAFSVYSLFVHKILDESGQRYIYCILCFMMCVCRFIRDFAYDNVANNRYSLFGKSESCEI